MMRLLLLIALLVPAAGYCQYIPPDQLEENKVDEASHRSVKRSYWHLLRRATIRNPLQIWYRVAGIDGRHFLEIKVTKGGEGFLVARNEPMELLLQGGKVVKLYNSEYTHSCKGCGNRHGNGDRQGVTLTYPVPDEDFALLRKRFVDWVRIYSENNYMGAAIHTVSSEIFKEQFNLVFHSPDR